MWRSLITKFKINANADADKNSSEDDPEKYMGYGVMSNQDEKRFLLLSLLLRVNEFFARVMNLLRNRLWRLQMQGAGVSHLMCYPATLRWIDRLAGGLGPYQALCSTLGISTSVVSTAKAYYVTHLIRQHASINPTSALLEIGGGFGNVPLLLHKLTGFNQYLVIDLPEMLLHSSAQLHRFFPQASFNFVFNPAALPDFSLPGFYFMPPEMAKFVPENWADAAINIDSFQEMTAAQIATYLTTIQSVVRPDGVFLNLNRRKFLQEEGFDNNPLTYPYCANNALVRWEADEFMLRAMNYDQSRTDSWMLRVEQIKK